MAPRTRHTTRVALREDVVRSPSGLRVDRDAGVIYGVKVLGLESANGRRYLREAVERALPFYEGRSVRINHPKRPQDQRDSEDVFGKLRDVQMAADGAYGNLHYLKSHPMAERVCEAAERMPDVFGLSHNAQGDGRQEGGVFVVTEITEVRSVDLVADPATTNGLFESKGHRTTMKLKAWMEGLKGLDGAKRRTVKRLLSEGVMDGDVEMSGDMPAEAAPPEDHTAALTSGFEASCVALIQQALSGDMDPSEALKKLKDMLTSHQKLTGDGGEQVEESDEDEDGEEVEESEDCDDPEKKKMAEGRELKLLRREKRARVLCEEAGVVADSVLLESLARLPDDTAVKRMIDREKKRAPGKSAPKSGSGAGKKALTESTAAEDVGTFIESLRG